MQEAIDRYFADCDEKGKPYTITGLAIALDFEGRRSLIDYCDYKDENNKSFFNTIKRAKDIVEASIEENMIKGTYNPTASIFNLKNNFGWKDKTEVENSGEQNLNVNIKVMDNGS